jgi:hypothetical protein
MQAVKNNSDGKGATFGIGYCKTPSPKEKEKGSMGSGGLQA